MDSGAADKAAIQRVKDPPCQLPEVFCANVRDLFEIARSDVESLFCLHSRRSFLCGPILPLRDQLRLCILQPRIEFSATKPYLRKYNH